MRRPAIHALLLFIVGVLLANSLDLPVSLLLSVITLTLIFSAIFILRKDKASATLFLILSLILSGFVRYELATRDFPSNHVSNLLGLSSKVTISGKIVEEPDVRKSKTFITVDTDRISVGERIHSTSGRIILKVREPTFRFDYADNIRFQGYLNPPASKRNPGAFDYKRYLNRKNIHGIVTLSSTDEVEILGRGTPNLFQSKIVIPLRRWILSVFDRTLSGNHQALLSGFLLGETREIPKEVYNMFRDTGTVHLLAVSGSNVWLVIAVILAALSLLRVPKLPTTLLSMLCILIFANLVHNDPPVVRAGIMAAVVLVGVLLYKDVDLVNVVSFSGLAILFYSPLFLFDVGFQLSFASVFAILLVYPPLSKLASRYLDKSQKKLWRWIIVPALVSVSVELVLFPILAYYFNMVPLVIVVANIFIVPLAGLSVTLACVAIFSAIFSTTLAGVFSACNWLCLGITLKLTAFFAQLPIAKLSVPAPSPTTFILYYFFLWLLLSSISFKRKAVIFSILMFANLIIWKQAFAHDNKLLRLTFLDVGKGSSAVVDLPNGQTFLTNAGQKEKNFDAGEYVVIPFLNHQGTTKLDRLLLTDTDPSSLNSALSVMKDAEVEQVFVPVHLFPSKENLGDFSERMTCDLHFLESAGVLRDGKGKFEIRFSEYPETARLKLACRGTLTRIRYEKLVFCLLDGMRPVHFDPEFDWNQFRNCSVLVLSELGNADDIVQVISAVRPQKVIFTRHYFRYEKEKIPLLMQLSFPELEYYRTAESGAIICETDGHKLCFDLTIR